MIRLSIFSALTMLMLNGCSTVDRLRQADDVRVLPIHLSSPFRYPGLQLREPEQQVRIDGLLLQPPTHSLVGLLSQASLEELLPAHAPSLVVMLPGGMSSAESAVDAGRYLAAGGHTVMVLTLRGRGASGGRATYGLDEVMDVRAAIDHALQNVIHPKAGQRLSVKIVGFSSGAVVALNSAFSDLMNQDYPQNRPPL